MEIVNQVMTEVQFWIHWVFEGPQAVFVPLVAGALAIGALATLWLIIIWLNERKAREESKAQEG